MKSLLMILTSFVTLAAHADVDKEIVESGGLSSLLEDQTPASTQTPVSLGWDGIYEVPKDIQVQPKATFINGEAQTLGEDEAVQLFRGENIAVKIEGDNAVITMAPLIGEGGAIEEQKIVLSREQADQLGLKILGRGDERDLTPSYSLGKNELAGRAVLRQNGRIVARGCLAWVLIKLGIRPKGGVGGASNFANYLIKKHGWKSVSCKNPPVGAVGSWRGRPHTARWNGKGWCYDQGCHDPGKGYHLFQCARP